MIGKPKNLPPPQRKAPTPKLTNTTDVTSTSKRSLPFDSSSVDQSFNNTPRGLSNNDSGSASIDQTFNNSQRIENEDMSLISQESYDKSLRKTRRDSVLRRRAVDAIDGGRDALQLVSKSSNNNTMIRSNGWNGTSSNVNVNKNESETVTRKEYNKLQIYTNELQTSVALLLDTQADLISGSGVSEGGRRNRNIINSRVKDTSSSFSFNDSTYINLDSSASATNHNTSRTINNTDNDNDSDVKLTALLNTLKSHQSSQLHQTLTQTLNLLHTQQDLLSTLTNTDGNSLVSSLNSLLDGLVAVIHPTLTLTLIDVKNVKNMPKSSPLLPLYGILESIRHSITNASRVTQQHFKRVSHSGGGVVSGAILERLERMNVATCNDGINREDTHTGLKPKLVAAKLLLKCGYKSDTLNNNWTASDSNDVGNDVDSDCVDDVSINESNTNMSGCLANVTKTLDYLVTEINKQSIDSSSSSTNEIPVKIRTLIHDIMCLKLLIPEGGTDNQKSQSPNKSEERGFLAQMKEIKEIAFSRGKALAVAEMEIVTLKERLRVLEGGSGGSDGSKRVNRSTSIIDDASKNIHIVENSNSRKVQQRRRTQNKLAHLALQGWEQHGVDIVERFGGVWQAYADILNGGGSGGMSLNDVRRGKAGKPLAHLLITLESALHNSGDGDELIDLASTAERECEMYKERIFEICEAFREDFMSDDVDYGGDNFGGELG